MEDGAGAGSLSTVWANGTLIARGRLLNDSVFKFDLSMKTTEIKKCREGASCIVPVESIFPISKCHNF